jgi:hypothetical protein
MKLSRYARIIFLGAVFVWPHLVSAQTKPSQTPIIFDSFTGIYHLDRDSRGHSLLTTEETLVADFGSGYYGITRELPKDYQGRSVNIKILSVVDAASNPIPYKTEEKAGNLVITTGDPAITLYGSQTIKIRYQTSGVVNLSGKLDEFLLNVNGRGWDYSISRVDATLYIPGSFRASLVGAPSCYTALDKSISTDCRINNRKINDTAVISSRAGPLATHQALVLKMEFASSTFTDNKSDSNKKALVGAAAVFIFAAAASSYRYLRRK